MRTVEAQSAGLCLDPGVQIPVHGRVSRLGFERRFQYCVALLLTGGSKAANGLGCVVEAGKGDGTTSTPFV